MNEYLIIAIDPDAYDPELYRGVIRSGMLGEYFVLDILHTEDPTLPGDTLLGAWNKAGDQVSPFDQVAFEQIRPLGNLPTGEATYDLVWHYYSSWRQRQLGTDGKLYPDDTLPFAIEIRHKEFTGNVNPEWDGWGYRAEIVGSAASRDPSARAIGIYSDPECTQYLYTTGAFVQMESDWQVDEAGTPITVWATQTPEGWAETEKQDWHIACLLGSAQEGHNTLRADVDGVTYLFWEHDQPSTGGGSAWVDTGATVTSQAGQLFYVSSAAVAASLTPGQAIRFGDTLETTFVALWPGTDDLLEIDPYVAAQVGDVLWAWE